MNLQAFLSSLWAADTTERRPSHYRGGGMWDGSNRHGVRRERKGTPGYKLARRFWPGLDRDQILAKLSDLSTLTGRRPMSRRTK